MCDSCGWNPLGLHHEMGAVCCNTFHTEWVITPDSSPFFSPGTAKEKTMTLHLGLGTSFPKVNNLITSYSLVLLGIVCVFSCVPACLFTCVCAYMYAHVCV